jgi:hypothetical protein
VDDTVGVQSVIALPSIEIERLEGEDETNPNYIQFRWNNGGLTFENWQIAHFRLLGNEKYNPYGTSVLDPARRLWRQLTMMVDSMMAYRITRSAEKLVFKVPVGGINEEDIPGVMEAFISSTKRHQIVDPDTGRIDQRFNPVSIEENLYFPTVGGEGPTVETLTSRSKSNSY